MATTDNPGAALDKRIVVAGHDTQTSRIVQWAHARTIRLQVVDVLTWEAAAEPTTSR